MIEKTIQTLLKEHPTSTGDNLLGMTYDLEHFLGRCAGVCVTSFRVTEYPACLLDIEMHATEQARSQRDIHRELERVWWSCRYSHFQCSSVDMTQEHLILRFATVIAADSFCVTGVFRVTGKRWSELVI